MPLYLDGVHDMYTYVKFKLQFFSVYNESISHGMNDGAQVRCKKPNTI